MSAVESLVAVVLTTSALVPDDAWASLVGGSHTFTAPVDETCGPGASDVILFEAYVLGLPSDARIRIVVDGSEVVQSPPITPLIYVSNLAPGTHTVDFQAISDECDEDVQAGPRGLVALKLGRPTV